MRSISKWFGLIALGLALLGALAVTVQAQGTGVLEGLVVNGTAGGPDVGAGVVVTLHVFRGDSEVDTLETTTSRDGRFRFDGLDTDPDLEYWPEALYLDVPYSSAESYQFGAGQGTLDATITVYETTDEDSEVSLDSVHFIAQSFDQVLRVTEIHLFGNSGDRTFIGGAIDGGPLATVYIPLPENAVGLALEEGTSEGRFVEVEGGLMDTEPVLPGRETSLVFFSYHLIVAGDAIPLERYFAYPVSNLSALVAQPGLALRTDQLQSRGPQLFEGQQYEFYTSGGLAANTPLVLDLLPMPNATSTQGVEGVSSSGDRDAAGAPIRGNQELLRWFGFGLAGVAVIGALVYALALKPTRSVSASARDLSSDPQARRLIADLADLEEAFEAGRVDETTYERQRAETYEALKSL